MNEQLYSEPYDLVSPDGVVTSLKRLTPSSAEAMVSIYNISPAFIGFSLDTELLCFNFKSTLAQVGLDGVGKEYILDAKNRSAQVKVELLAFSELGEFMLGLLSPGAFVGKLFAADERRRVREPEYLLRMFGRVDREGKPLLLLGKRGQEDLSLEKKEGRLVATLPTLPGLIAYEPSIKGLMLTLAKALHHPEISLRALLSLHQNFRSHPRKAQKGEMLLVRTLPLHVRTVFAKVVETLLPQGVHHTTASILEPTTEASGDIYEFFGESTEEVTHVPLEFYTLEPYREHVFFADRDQLQLALEKKEVLFNAFETAKGPKHHRCGVFVVKSQQLFDLKNSDWVCTEPKPLQFTSQTDPQYKELMVESFIPEHPVYPFLKSIEKGLITSQGVLFLRYFPSPILKSLLLSDPVRRCLKRIYFQYPSLSCGDFFSHEDRALLIDLSAFNIPTFWVDKTSGEVLEYVAKPEKDSGMFAPLHLADSFRRATSFGMYGSNLVVPHMEKEMTKLLEGIKKMRESVDHPLLNKNTPIALVTGGGLGVMELGNKVARKTGVLSCANIVDFRGNVAQAGGDQRPNPYIDIKMTYRVDRLIERQAEFNLDFPIILAGGIGTDFEYALEEVRRKVGAIPPTPVLLFGEEEYFRKKITPRFQCNLENKTIQGSEWISNCFYCVQTAEQGLKIYQQFLSGALPIGKHAPMRKEGFVIV